MINQKAKFLDPKKFVLSCIEQMAEKEIFLPFTVSNRLQREAIEELKILKKEILNVKYAAIEEKQESLANLMLGLQHGINSFIAQLNCMISLKESHYREAWNFLIDAQEYTIWSYRAAPHNQELQCRYENLITLEKAYFPKMSYVSIGCLISDCKCSICGQLIDKCDHLEGLPYMGKICCLYNCRMSDFNHTALVDEPRDKRCIIETFSDDKNENEIDVFTREINCTIPLEKRSKKGTMCKVTLLRTQNSLELF